MRRSTWITAALTFLLAGGAADVHAQEGARSASEIQAERLFRGNVLTLGLAAGGAAFSDFQRAEAVSRDEVFDRRISAQTSLAFSATATYWISRYWGVRAHGSYAPTRFVLRAPTEEMGQDQSLYSALGVYMVDGDVLFRAPIVVGRVAPYGLVGAGIVDYRADPGNDDPLPAEAKQTFDGDHQRRFAGVVGIGAVIPLDRQSFHLTFELTNHLTRSPVEPPAGGTVEDNVVIDPDGWRGDDDGSGLTSNVRLMIGVSLPIAF